MIPKLADELALITRMRVQKIDCRAFDGLTTPEQRREIVRDAIRGSNSDRFSEEFAKGAAVMTSSSSTSRTPSSAHGTATREASQGRSSSSVKSSVTAEVHGASLGPEVAGVQ